MSKRIQFHILNATCVVCLDSAISAFEANDFPEVESLSRDPLRKTISITLKDSIDDEEDTLEEIRTKHLKAFMDSGYECEMVRSENNYLFKGLIGIISILVGATLIALSLFGVAIPFGFMIALVCLSSLFTLALGMGSYIDAFKKLFKSKKVTMDTLFAISTLTVIGVSIASLFLPGLSMMLEVGVLIFGFRYLGKAIEEIMRSKLIAKLSFMDRAPKKVEKKNEELGTWEMCMVDALEIGDIIRVKKGQYLPVDGVSKSKQASLLKTIKDGSINPSHVNENDAILAGMKVCSEEIELSVSNTVRDSFLSRLDQVNDNVSEKAPIQNFTEKIMQYFVPGVILLALLSGILIGCLFNIALGIQCAIALFVSACPCALGLVSELAYMIGRNKATHHGVRFKSNYAISQANNIDVVVIDMFGTLTEGAPRVVDFKIFPEKNISEDDFFSSLTAIEKDSPHAIAKAIAKYGINKTSANHVNVAEIDTSHHSGIRAKINDDVCLVGNSHFLLHHKIKFSPINIVGSHIVYYVINDDVVGYVELRDPLREDAKFTIRELKRMGKKVFLASGEKEEVVQFFAKQLEVAGDNVFANMNPIPDSEQLEIDENCIDNKFQLIQYQQSLGKRVAMIGDAENDAPALKQSDFPIAVTSGSIDDKTKYEASAVVENSSLLPIISAFMVSKETDMSIKATLILSLVYNVVTAVIAGGILIPLGFALNPVIGVVLMLLQFTLILVIQFAIMNRKLPHLERYQHEMEPRSSAAFFSSHKNAKTPEPIFESVDCDFEEATLCSS